MVIMLQNILFFPESFVALDRVIVCFDPDFEAKGSIFLSQPVALNHKTAVLDSTLLLS